MLTNGQIYGSLFITFTDAISGFHAICRHVSHFLESLALVGMLLPGTVMMTSVGALIGSGEVGFYTAWAAATVGCLMGDWLSYFIGRRFKEPLHRWSFLKNINRY